MSGVDPNGGGPLLVPGGAAAPPEGTGLTSVTAGEWDTPSTLAARLAAEAPAVLDAARTTSYDFSSGAGVTLVNGNGTAAVTGGQVVLTTASGANTASPNAPTATVSLPTTIDPWRGVDIIVRLVGFTGTLGTTANRMWLAIGSVTNAANASWGSVGDWSVALYSQPDGAVLLGDAANGSAFANRATSAAGALLLDGDDWVRLIFRSGGYEAFSARGSSLPTTWTRRGASCLLAAPASSAAFSAPAYVTMRPFRSRSSSGAATLPARELPFSIRARTVRPAALACDWVITANNTTPSASACLNAGWISSVTFPLMPPTITRSSSPLRRWRPATSKAASVEACPASTVMLSPCRS